MAEPFIELLKFVPILTIAAGVAIWIIWNKPFAKRHPKEHHSNEQMDLSEVFNKTFTEFFSDAEKYKTLKKGELSVIADDKIKVAVYSWIYGKFNEDWSNQYQVVSSLSKTCQNICAAFIVEDFFHSGKFKELRINSFLQFVDMANEGFLAIGAPEFADITARADILYKQKAKEMKEHGDINYNSFMESYENSPLNELDNEFLDMYKSGSLEKLYIEYIRKNENCFGD